MWYDRSKEETQKKRESEEERQSKQERLKTEKRIIKWRNTAFKKRQECMKESRE